MSLLNQVLQDLEKRKVETNKAPDQFQLKNIRAAKSNVKKGSLFSSILLIGTIISLVILCYRYYQSQSSITKTGITPHSNSKINQLNAKNAPSAHLLTDHKAETPPLKPVTIVTATKQDIPDRVTQASKPQPKKKLKLQIQQANHSKRIDTLIDQPLIETPALSNNQKAENLFTSAKKLTPSTEKVNILEQAIALNIKHINARLLLVSTFLQLGLTNQVSTLLDQSLILFPQNIEFIKLRSQLFLKNKQAGAALQILTQIDATYVQDEAYLGLLGAAYQQRNIYAKSLSIYQRLLTINPEKAENWLGLAIASENQGFKQQALDAYQQALNKNTLKPVIVSYINTRISILK